MTETPNPNIIDADTLTGEMRPIRRGVLSIGSNLGDRMVYLQGAVDALADTPDIWVTAVSPVYETAPVDAPDGSGDYLNAVVLIDTTLSVTTLLERALTIEAVYGRERAEHHGPRTLDIDLIMVGDRVADTDRLRLPHPAAHERAFVLAPWHDLEPDATLLRVGSVAELLHRLVLNGQGGGVGQGDHQGGIVRRDDLELTVS